MTAPLRVAVCGLLHESNAFAADTTPIEAFYRFRGERVGVIGRDSGTEVGGALLGLDDAGAIAVPTTVAMGLSSGPVDDAAVHELVGELAAGVATAHAQAPLDAVVVCLHGSMIGVSDPDVEGTALRRLRETVGALPVVATLDWHCSISPAMVDAADALVSYRTYPHIDQEERGREAAALAAWLAGRTRRLHAAHRQLPLLIAGPQTRHESDAMGAVLAEARRLAADDTGIATWSVCPGFARSDTEWSGTHVYAAGPDAAAVESAVTRLSSMLWERRRLFDPVTTGVGDAVTCALGAAPEDGPVVLSDQGDNPGGGAPGDSPVLLAELERQGATGAVVASLCAPEVVSRCHDLGVGAMVGLRVDGVGDLDVTVEALADGKYVMRSPTHPNVPFDIGPVARVRTPAGVVVVVTSFPVQNEDLQMPAMLGIDVTAAPIVVVKSNAHFRAAFEPIASEVIDVDTPGLSTPHLDRLPYRRVRRPAWPLDRDLTWSPA